MEVGVLVVVGASRVVYVVYFEWGVIAAALGALVTITRQDAFAGGGGDVFGAVCPHHRLLTALLLDREDPRREVGVPVRGLVSHASISQFGGLFVKSRGVFIHKVLFAPVNVPHRGFLLVDVPVDEPA